MRLFKQMIIAGAMLLGMAVSVQATAAEYHLGTLSSGYTTFGPNPVNDMFTDTVFFSVTGDSGSFGAGVLNFNVGGTPLMHVSDFSMSLFGADGASVGSGLDFTVDTLVAGDYYLKISGNADGLHGGMYAGGINIPAVPEPGMWNMLFAGLLMMGFTALRLRDLD